MRTLIIFGLFVTFILGMNYCTGNASLPKEHSVLDEGTKDLAIKKGQEIASAAFMALSGKLQNALNASGVEGAINYCHITALPLTDSLSKMQQAIIKRTSLQLRNPANAPDEQEKVVLEKWLEPGADLSPVVLDLGHGKVKYLAPIRIAELCLKCHGKISENIAEEDYALIHRLYPDDRATGYQINDIRGSWSIEFLMPKQD